MKIYLDDIRTPADSSWIVIRTPGAFKEFFSCLMKSSLHERPKIEISFDHDLGEDHYEIYEQYEHTPVIDGVSETGYDLAKWMIDNKIIPNVVHVHSANSGGAKNIINLFENREFSGYDGPPVKRTFWQCYTAPVRPPYE